MWEWTCPVLGGAILVFWLRKRAGKYERMLAPAHVVEVAEGIAALKRAALEGIDQHPEAISEVLSDPRLLRTSAGLRFLYDIHTHETSRFIHHVSVSVIGGSTPGAIGQRFILLWALVLNIPLERLTLEHTSTTIHHAEMLLTAQEQQAFVAAPVREVTTENVEALLGEVESLRERSRWNRVSATES